MTSREGRLPNFLIVGAPKSGTTSLSRYLRHHPDVFMAPVEEPKYFAYRNSPPRFASPDAATILAGTRWRRADYTGLFAGWRDQKAGGEKSALYLWSAAAPGAISEEIPEARLIAILRNPADRAYSHFAHNLRCFKEPLTDFRAALAAEPERKNQGWSYRYLYRDHGRYAEQLERYSLLFPREQMLILLYDDLVADAAGAMRTICRHLGVSQDHDLKVSERHNVSEGVRHTGMLYRALRRESLAKSAFRMLTPRWVQRRLWLSVYNRNLDPLPAFDPTLRRELVDEFGSEVRRLERLIGRDLSGWLSE